MRRSAFLSVVALAGCSHAALHSQQPPPGSLAAVRIAVLGDSLAFGTGASSPENGFIFRSFTALRRQRPGSEIDSFAMGGSTAADVLRLQVPRLRGARFDAVVICVGGNDVVRRVDPAGFASTYARLVSAVHARQPSARVVCCGVPNVGVSPLFSGFDHAEITRLARADDDAVRSAARGHRAEFVNLFAATSLQRGQEERFLSDDRFHPSDAGYAQLADVLTPVLARALGAPNQRR
jgi:lysophospholipase L1-like esterase